ncbi:MAG: MCE family protein [Deltaproteobacteria bacterium]|nr:MCE family protein [Candidatus Tharpella aukensis]
MLKKLFFLAATLFLIVGGVTIFRGLDGQSNVTVTFANAKHLMVDDHVYLSGALVGKVRAIKADARQVAVTINLKKGFFAQISSTSSFFIDNDARNDKRKCVLVRLSHKTGNPITPETRLVGVDSAFAWSIIEAEKRMAEMTNSEPLEKSSDDLAKVWQDIRQAFAEIDFKKMEKALAEKTEQLRQTFNQARESESYKQTMTEIENKLEELKQAIKGAADSQAVQELKETLEGLFKKLEKESPERSDVKI